MATETMASTPEAARPTASQMLAPAASRRLTSYVGWMPSPIGTSMRTVDVSAARSRATAAVGVAGSRSVRVGGPAGRGRSGARLVAVAVAVAVAVVVAVGTTLATGPGAGWKRSQSWIVATVSSSSAAADSQYGIPRRRA